MFQNGRSPTRNGTQVTVTQVTIQKFRNASINVFTSRLLHDLFTASLAKIKIKLSYFSDYYCAQWEKANLFVLQENEKFLKKSR